MSRRDPQFRYEQFGGILAMHQPRGLAYVDRDYARSLGFSGSPLWSQPATPIGEAPLSGPTEVHLVLSKRCAAGCTGCYVDATPQGAALSEADAKVALDRLAGLGVFHVALGGGEAVDLPYLLAVARYARKLGITPNLTTSGLSVDEPFAREAAKVFGQVNVSLDGLREAYQASRGFDGFGPALRGLERLRAHSRHVGINCVVSRQNADHLGPLVALARKLRLSEVEFLRYKPAGRGDQNFADRDLTADQALRLYPRALWFTLRYWMRIKLDCSFAPMIFAHNPPQRVVDFFGVQGCVGGDVLASVMPDGQWKGCSFGGPDEGDIRDGTDQQARWASGFDAFRAYAARAPEPCASCAYLSLCRGGCRVVAKAAGDWWRPDPGCPKVQAHAAKSGAASRGLKLPLWTAG